MKHFFLSLIFTGILIVAYSQPWKTYLDSAKILRDEKNTAEAILYYNKAKEHLPADSVLTDTYIRLSKSLAELYYNARQPDKSLLTCNELLTIIKKLHTEENSDYAWTCNLLGAIYNNAGKFDTAKALHITAKNIREKLFGKKDRSYAQSCNNLGALYHDLGQFDLAESLFLEAKSIRQNIEPVKKSPVYAITCVALANLYRDMGQYDKAKILYVEAKEIRSTRGTNNDDYANSCNILADLYNYMHQYENAETLYLEAKSIRAKLDSGSYEYGESCNNLAILYKEMKQYDKAKKFIFEAKSVFEKELPEGHPTRIINLNNLGEVYYAIGKYKDAESYFLQARQLWKEKLGIEHPYTISNAEELAKVYWNINDVQKADQLFSEVSLLKYEQLNKIFRFTNETEKQIYLENINGSMDDYQSFYYKKIPHNIARQAYSISILNRNLVLSSTQQLRQVIYNSADTALTRTYQQWGALKEQLANLFSKVPSANTAIAKDLTERSDSIEKELSRRSAAFKKTQATITWKDIRQNLHQDEAAIEYVEFKLSDAGKLTDSILYVALVLTKDKGPVLVPLFEKKQLDSLLTNTANKGANETVSKLYASRGIIVKGNNNAMINKSVYSLVWKPLEKELKGIKTVYFAPAGLLHRIAFAALPVNKNEVVSDKYKLIQLATTASVIYRVPSFITSSDNLQLYGGINYDADSTAWKKTAGQYAVMVQKENARSIPVNLTRSSSFSFLPGTTVEAKAIEKNAKDILERVSFLSGTDATEESFKVLDGRSSPSVIHIATHGFFFPDPKAAGKINKQIDPEINGQAFRMSDDPLLRSGLLFAGANNTWQGKGVKDIEDGILTAYEVSNMYLPNTKLVVLSACETALGDVHGSEGVYGLQRAFKMAGVQNLVMSLWKVPDAETAEFMQLFYKNMFTGQSVNDAFYHTQTTIKNKYRNDPYKWAAWVLIN